MRILVLASLLAATNAFAQLPTGGSVTSGQASIQSNGSTLQVTSTTSSAIINWQSFSIGAGATTSFNQPTASSAVLNRVIGANPSQIIGSLQSNGHVYLINANGVTFASGSQVNTAGFVATTSNVSDATFLANSGGFLSTALAGQGTTFGVDAAFAMAGGELTLGATTINMTGAPVTTGNMTIGTPAAGSVNLLAQPITTTAGTLGLTPGSLTLTQSSATSGGALTLGTLSPFNTSATNVASTGGSVLLSAPGNISLISGTLTTSAAPATTATVTLSSGVTPAGSVLAPLIPAPQPFTAPMTVISANVALQKREPYY